MVFIFFLGFWETVCKVAMDDLTKHWSRLSLSLSGGRKRFSIGFY